METVVKKNIYGQSLTLVKNDYITKKIYKHGLYDRIGLSFIRSFLLTKQSPVAIDVGSNIGNHAVVMSKYCDNVIAFEPQKEIYELLRENIQQNNITNIKSHNVGLSNKDNDELEFYQNSSDNTGASGFMHNIHPEYYKVISLPVRLGDNLLKEIEKIDIIKMDVEGFEPFALLGLKETIRRHRPLIILEWDMDNINTDFKKNRIMEDILVNYNIKGLISNYDNSLFANNFFGKFKKEIYKSFNKKTWELTDFIPEKGYNNAIFFPKERENEIMNLPRLNLLAPYKGLS